MSTRTLTAEENRKLDKLAADCPRCDAWLGRMLDLGVLRKPTKERRRDQ